MVRPRLFHCSTLCALLCWGVGAQAQGVAQSASTEATARALFQEGRELSDKGQFALACPKFEESDRLLPGLGTKFNLAACYERQGKLASAWSLYLGVAAIARSQNDAERDGVATERARALLPRLMRLVIDVPEEAQVPGLEVLRDGQRVGQPQWGTALPVDAGRHELSARAPGYDEWRGSVECLKEGATQHTLVPVLRKSALAAAPGPDVPSSSDGMSKGRVAAWSMGGVALVAAGVGTFFGASSLSAKGDADKLCDALNRCSAAGLAAREDAISRGNVATGAFVVSGVALAVGVVLLLTSSPSAPPKRDLALTW